MFLKDAQAEVEYRVDWAAAGAAVAASGWQIVPDETGGLRMGGDGIDGAVARVRLAGGVPGHLYRVSNRVTLADGSVDERSLAIRVEER